MADIMLTNKKPMAQEVIKFADRVKVVDTGKTKVFQAGHLREIHPKQAEKQVQEGKVEIYNQAKHGAVVDGIVENVPAEAETTKSKK